MSEFTLTVYRDVSKNFRWRLASTKNHKIVAESGEGYQKISALLAIVKKVFGPATTKDTIDLVFFDKDSSVSGSKWITKNWPELYDVDGEGA